MWNKIFRIWLVFCGMFKLIENKVIKKFYFWNMRCFFFYVFYGYNFLVRSFIDDKNDFLLKVVKYDYLRVVNI